MSRIKDALTKAKRERLTPPPLHEKPVPEIDRPLARPALLTRTIPYSEGAVVKYKVLTPYFQQPDLIEHFKLLRTKILDQTQANDHRTLMVTSTLPGEGKTFVALNLAVTFAREVDQTVLLVDTNLQHPTLLESFGIKAEKGLTDYLLTDIPLHEVLLRPGIEKLTILPAGQPVDNSAELLRSQKMRNLVEEMKQRYSDRYIFFDSSSVLGGSVDALVLSQSMDTTLYVVESGRVKPQKVSEAFDLLKETRILGTIINKKSS